MIKVIVVDDHPIFLEGMKKIVGREKDIRLADTAGTGHELLQKCKTAHYDVIVLDISLPDRTGLELLQDLQAAGIDSPVLILSMHPEDQYAVRALKAGASGYLTKDAAPAEVIPAIRKVHAGGKYVSRTLGEKLAFNLDSKIDQPPHEALSDREFQVLCMMCTGKSLKEIAKELYLSVSTVSTYRSRIFQKMRFRNNADLIRYGIEKNLNT